MGWTGWKKVLRATGESKDSSPEKQTDTRGRVCPGPSLKGQRKPSVTDFSPQGEQNCPMDCLEGADSRAGTFMGESRQAMLHALTLGLAGTRDSPGFVTVVCHFLARWPTRPHRKFPRISQLPHL